MKRDRQVQVACFVVTLKQLKEMIEGGSTRGIQSQTLKLTCLNYSI